MIRHCVMLRLVPDADRAALAQVVEGLRDLVARLEGCNGFFAGPNRDFEGKSPDFPYGFTFDVVDHATLSAYATHPDHIALGARLMALCDEGSAGIIVYDIEGAP